MIFSNPTVDGSLSSKCLSCSVEGTCFLRSYEGTYSRNYLDMSQSRPVTKLKWVTHCCYCGIQTEYVKYGLMEPRRYTDMQTGDLVCLEF